MGVDVHAFKFLIFNSRPSLGKTLCLGRQEIHFSPDDGRISNLEILKKERGISQELHMSGPFAEELFVSLGSTHVDSMDISKFEGATVIHDMNLPISDELHNSYDCIFDGGTIEHIFNFPIAIENVKKMLRVGGVFYFIGGANNMLGHGLYQFSPEVLFRLFSKSNGYEILSMNLVETGGVGQFIDAPDPEALGHRNEISVTQSPTYLMMAAVKVSENTGGGVFQSDYVPKW